MGFVYKWLNIINGHWYIGSHDGDEDDGYVGSGVAFRHAYAKHGAEAFKREILYRGNDYLAEELFILRSLDAQNDPMSYNLINETRGFHGRKHSLESRQKLKRAQARLNLLDSVRKRKSENSAGKNNAMFGKKGEKHPASKLTQKQADEIRERLKQESIRLHDLGLEYGVSRFTIARIRDNIIYTNESGRFS